MPSLFDSYDKIAGDAVDKLNAELFILTPMKRSANGRSMPDASRSVVQGEGVFSNASIDRPLQFGNRRFRGSNDLRMLQTGRQPKLNVSREWFPEAMPKQGDRVEFEDELEPRYEVVSVQPDGHSRMNLMLVAVGESNA